MELDHDLIRALVRGNLGEAATVTFEDRKLIISMGGPYSVDLQTDAIMTTDFAPVLATACDTLSMFTAWKAGKLQSPREQYAARLAALARSTARLIVRR